MKKTQLLLILFALVLSFLSLVGSAAYAESENRNDPSQQEMITNAAKQAIVDRKPFIALRQLALLGSDLMDPALQQMVEQCFALILKDLDAVRTMQESRSAIEDIAVQQLIESAILNNPQLEERYVDILAMRAISLARIGYLPGLINVYEQFKLHAPANSHLRETLPQQIIDNAKGEARDVFAMGLIEDLQRRGLISPFDKLALFLKGYYVGEFGRNIILFTSFSLVVALGYYLIFVFWRPQALLKSVVVETFSQSKIPTAEDLLSEDDEYSRHLKVLGLDDSATDEQIKQSYRLLIKELHPDGSSAGKDPESLKRFRDVQYAYKRIKEMNEGRFS